MVDWSTCDAVERDIDRYSGAWLFRGTRVPVTALFENLEDGASIHQFVDWFPGVTLDQARSVLRLVRAKTSMARASSASMNDYSVLTRGAAAQQLGFGIDDGSTSIVRQELDTYRTVFGAMLLQAQELERALNHALESIEPSPKRAKFTMGRLIEELRTTPSLVFTETELTALDRALKIRNILAHGELEIGYSEIFGEMQTNSIDSFRHQSIDDDVIEKESSDMLDEHLEFTLYVAAEWLQSLKDATTAVVRAFYAATPE